MASRQPEASSANALQDVQQKADKVKGVLKNNLEMAIQRGQDIDKLDQDSSTLHTNADGFRSGARDAKRRLWRKQMRTWAIIFSILLIIVVIVAIIIWQSTK